MAAGAIAPAIGGVGDIMGIIGSLQQGSAMRGATNQLSGDLSQILGEQSGAVNHLLQSYFGTTLPELQQTISTLQPEQQQTFANALQYMQQAGGAANALENNPYLSSITGMAGRLSQPNANIGNMVGVASQLSKWTGLSPQQLNNLTMQAGNAANSAASTMKQQMGGVANPALLMKQLSNQAGITGQQAAVQLGSQAMADQLGAREAAGGLYGQAANEQTQRLVDAMQGYSTAGQQYLGGNSAAGSILSGLGSTSASMSGQEMQQMLDSLGIESQGLGYGMQGMGQEENTIGGLLSGLYSNGGSSMSDMGGLFGGLGSNVENLFGGQGSGSKSGMPGLPTGAAGYSASRS